MRRRASESDRTSLSADPKTVFVVGLGLKAVGYRCNVELFQSEGFNIFKVPRA